MKIFDMYIAGPYTHSDESVRQMRYHLLTEYYAHLTACGYNAFSPITHSHPVHYFGLDGQYLPAESDWPKNEIPPVSWMDIDRRIILGCAEVRVLMLPGWDQSIGVQDEIEWAFLNRIPVLFVDPETYEHGDTPYFNTEWLENE